MPGIIDEFVVSLGLDPKKYNEQVSKFRQDQKRLQEETRRNTREMEADTHRAIEGFSKLRNEIVGLFLVLAGGRSFGNLVEDMIHGAATTGRFAANIGLATEEVSAWEGAVRTAGGTAEEARAALAALNAEFTSFSLTGRATHDADLAALGIGMNTLRDPSELAMALAERSEHMSRREFAARMSRIGMPESVINTLARGRRGLQELIAEQYRLGVVTQRDTEAAQALEAQWANLTTRLRGELRPELTWLVETALPYLEQHGSAIANIVGVGLAGAFGLMALSLVRAAGPLGIVVGLLTTLIGLINQIKNSDQPFGFNADENAQLDSQRITDLRSALDAVPPFTRDEQGHVLNTPENWDIAAQRTAIIHQIMTASAASNGSATSAARGGHWWQLGGGGSGGNLARIRQTESGNNYNRVAYDALRPPSALTSMTLGQVYAWQRGPLRSATRGRRGPGDIGSTGVGAYQFESETMRSTAMRLYGAGWASHTFSNATQDELATALHAREGNRPWAIGQRGGARLAAGRGGGGGTAVSVGSIVVYTPPGTTGAQAAHVARAIPGAIRRRGVVTQANSGLQ